jgi:hypothetical protein
MSPRSPFPEDYRRTTLTPGGRRVVRALAEALFTREGETPLDDARLETFADEVDRFISPASKTLRFGLSLILVGLRFSPLLYFRVAALEDLPIAERITHLERIERSRLALLFVAYKTVLSMLFYEHERELARMGYPGPERERWKRALPVAKGVEEGP